MELLVRIADKRDEKDPVKDARLTKAGDVLAFHEDGADWGVMEVKNPEWRIVRVPKLSQEEAEALIAPELPPTLDKDYPLLRKRAMRLDVARLDALENGVMLADKALESVVAAHDAYIVKQDAIIAADPTIASKQVALDAATSALAVAEAAATAADDPQLVEATIVEKQARDDLQNQIRQAFAADTQVAELDVALKQAIQAGAVHAELGLANVQSCMVLKEALK